MKYLLIALFSLHFGVVNASETRSQSVTILNAATATGAGSQFGVPEAEKTFHVSGFTTAGAGSATVKIQVSNDLTKPWVDLATVTLTLGTTPVSDGFATQSSWLWVRANVTALSGTGASVSASLGY